MDDDETMRHPDIDFQNSWANKTFHMLFEEFVYKIETLQIFSLVYKIPLMRMKIFNSQ